MNTENTPHFDNLSPEEKVKYLETEYKKETYRLYACAGFLLAVIICLMLHLSFRWLFSTNVLVTSIFGVILVTLQWLITTKSYNRILTEAEAQNLTPNIKTPASNFLPVYCSNGLSLLLLLEMMPVTYCVTMYQSELMLVAYGTAIVSAICFIVNVCSLNNIKRHF